MNLSLSELLPLVGRLDSTPGFDSPRERYRRFLLEHVTDVPTARGLIEECQRSVGEQRHRALQDLVVLLGRFLGFETIFGSYDRSAGSLDGQWRSRGLLDVILEIRTEQTTIITADSLVRAVAGMAGPTRIDACPRIGLAVVARHFTARGRLEQAMAADAHSPELRIVSVRSLLALASQATADRLSHLEVVKLLQSGFALDFVIDLLDRPAPPSDAEEQPAEAVPPPEGERHEPSFWVATVIGNEVSPPEQLLGSVIANRRVLGVCHAGPLQAEGALGDWVCFFLPGKGIVGHAQLASIVDDKSSVVRNAEQFSRVYRLARVEMYEEPIVQALRSGRPFAVPSADAALAGPCLAPIARQDFIALTTYRDEVVSARRASA
jgi:hypothetical protein